MIKYILIGLYTDSLENGSVLTPRSQMVSKRPIIFIFLWEVWSSLVYKKKIKARNWHLQSN